MALQLNLLHEEINEKRQRKRDPLKLGIIGLSTFGALLFLYYGLNAYQTIQIKSELSLAEAEWQKVEPKVTAAQKRAAELHQIIDSTKVLDGLIEERFYWAPFLAQVSKCVAPNLQVTGLDGLIAETDQSVTVTLEGLAAAREPRAAAEEFRQLLAEQLEKTYSDVKVNFRNLEDLDTLVSLAGAPTPSARFVLNVSFTPKSGEAAKADGPSQAIAKSK
ncbi:MAG: hypothetical protein M3Q46_00800 [Verrucomicrobiota bacterium]|nr:hypothetical protein [Verrucomicrobiota bacterium]